MDDFNSIFASRTFWGGLLAIAAGVLGFFGWTLTADDQQALVDLGVGVAAALGGLVAIWGRVRASKQIGKGE